MFGIKKLTRQLRWLQEEMAGLHNVIDRSIAEQISTQRVVTNYFTKFRTPTKIDCISGYDSVKGNNQTRDEMLNVDKA